MQMINRVKIGTSYQIHECTFNCGLVINPGFALVFKLNE